MADEHDQHTQADRPTSGDPDAVEQILDADGSAWRAWVQSSIERLEARIHAMSASDAHPTESAPGGARLDASSPRASSPQAVRSPVTRRALRPFERIAAGAAMLLVVVLLAALLARVGLQPGVVPTSTAAQPTATVVTVTVPNFVGMQLRDAQTLAQQDHLKVVVTYVMDASHPWNLVIDQSPAADMSVPKDSEVTLTVSAGGRRVTVPDVVGKDSADACLTLSKEQLTCSIPSDGHQYSATVPLGHVIKTDPKAGTVIDLSAPNANTTVNIYVSLGPPPATATPHG